MGSPLLNFVFLLVYAAFTSGGIELYITPSVDSSSPQDPRVTLSQFAADPRNYTGNDTDISLVFLPGNHTLEGELSLYGADNFSMKSQDNEAVTIECASQSARFIVNETIFVTIEGLQFVGCGGNAVITVDQLLVTDTIFEGVQIEGRGTTLVLDEVTFAKIIRSSFISNTPGINSQRHYAGEFVRDRSILYYLLIQNLVDLSVGGALSISSSDVLVTDTHFHHNTAELGGVLLAYKSNITITQCICSYNKGLYGGVMFTIESLVAIDNSTFSNKAAGEDISELGYSTAGVYYEGGDMFTYGGTFTIMRSTFTNNTAAWRGGVIAANNNGTFTVTSSTFTNNTAAFGGVMFA